MSELGINMIGDLHGDSGLCQACRNIVSAIETTGLALTYNEIIFSPTFRTTPFAEPMSGFLHPVNLIHLNAPEMRFITPAYGLEALMRYNIGYWFYEISYISPQWRQQLLLLDELWVASHHVQAIFQTVADIPVLVIPQPVKIKPSADLSRSKFDLPQDRFIFLFSFSLSASIARKNPFGLIQAFTEAFSHQANPPLLLIKTQGAEEFPEMWSNLQQTVQTNENIRLLNRNLTRQDMTDLLAMSDAYISLHRAEGFGLGMAEAMALGKPVIGTGWSSNTDFMKPENSYLVDYKLMPIQEHHHQNQTTMTALYQPYSSEWAEPDLHHAAHCMRQVYENPVEVAARGERAAQFMNSYHSIGAVGKQIHDRLQFQADRIADKNRTKHISALWQLGDAVEQWDKLRREPYAASATHPLILRLKPLGFFYRLLLRISTLSQLFAGQLVIYQKLLHTILDLETTIKYLEQRQQPDDQQIQPYQDQE